jgi:hypothetical protein
MSNRLALIPLVVASSAIAKNGEILVDTGTGDVYVQGPGGLKSKTTGLGNKQPWQDPVVDMVSALPTTGLAAGDRYVYLGATAGGLIQNGIYQRDQTNTIWNLISPTPGYSVYNNADQLQYVFNGSTWGPFSGTGAAVVHGSWVQGAPSLIGTGDGVSLSFPLPYSGQNETIWRGGSVMLKPVDYSVSGTLATFATAPAAGEKIVATASIFVPVASGSFIEGSPTIIGTGDGAKKSFALPGNGLHETVWAGGAVQIPGIDYNNTAGSAVFIAAPPAGVQIVAKASVATTAIPTGGYAIGSPALIGTGNGVSTSFVLSGTNETLWRGGSVLTSPADYTVSSGSAFFVVPPAMGEPILCAGTVFVPATAPGSVGGGSNGAMSHPVVIGTGDGITTLFHLPGAGEEFVWSGGAIRERPTEYTRSVNDITFLAPPPIGMKIVASCSIAAMSGTDAVTLGGHSATDFVKVTDPVLPTPAQLGALAGTVGVPGPANKFVTETDSRLLTLPEEAALAGTNGVPSATNKFVTDSDPRLVTKSFATNIVTALPAVHVMLPWEVLLVGLTAAPASHVRLPTTPPKDTQIIIKDIKGNFGSFQLTVDCGGADKVEVNGDTNMILDVNGMSITLIYDGSGSWWMI